MQYFVMCMFVCAHVCVCEGVCVCVCGHLQWELGKNPFHFLMNLLVLQATSQVSKDARTCCLAVTDLAAILMVRDRF